MINRKMITAMAFACLTGTVLCLNVTAAEAEITPLHYELEEVGTVTEEERAASDPFMLADGNQAIENISRYEYLDNGTFTVTKELTREDPNTTGLYTSDGTQLLAPEYAMIDEPFNKQDGSERFLCVAKTDGETTEKEEAFLYLTASMVSLGAGEEDVLYTGTAQVYDLQEQRLVDGVEFNALALVNGFYDIGDAFAVQDVEAGTVTMYSPEGEVLREMTGYYPNAGESTLCVRGEDGYVVLGSDGSELLKSKHSIDLIDPDHDIFSLSESADDGTTYHSIVDKNGNVVIEQTPSMPYTNHTGYIEYKSEDTYMLVDHAGEMVVDHVKYVNPDFHGYVSLKLLEDGNETAGVITPAGVFTDLAVVDSSGYMVYSEGSNLLVLNTGEVSLSFEEGAQIDALTTAFVRVGITKDDKVKYGVYDLFTGEQLLDFEYDTILMRGEHLFARKDDSDKETGWEVYKVSLAE